MVARIITQGTISRRGRLHILFNSRRGRLRTRTEYSTRAIDDGVVGFYELIVGVVVAVSGVVVVGIGEDSGRLAGKETK